MAENRLKEKRKIFGLISAMVFCVMCVSEQPVSAAENCEVVTDGTMNHYEWPAVCIYAYNIECTSEELASVEGNGSLSEWILEKSMPEVRYAPEYVLEAGGISEVDISEVKKEPNAEGYDVTLYTSEDRSNNYIKIKVFVRETLPVETSKTEPIQSKKETKVVAGEKFEPIRESDYTEEKILFGISGGIWMIGGIFAASKLRILCWHAKKKGGRIL